MNFKRFLTAGLLGLAALYSAAQSANRVSFNQGWLFEKDGQSRVLDLPHDWGVEGAFDQAFPGETGKLPWWGEARYSKTLEVASEDLDQSFYLDIDGAMSGAKVYCNGEFVMEWPYGYASFRADLTPFLHAGANTVAVTLDNKTESSRWYPGGGIYRNVWLTKEARVAVAHWGTYVTTKVTGESSAEVALQVTLESKEEPYVGLITTQILEQVPELVSVAGRLQRIERVLAETRSYERVQDGLIVPQTFEIKNITLWTPESPKLYLARTTVKGPDGTEAVYETTFGIRTVEFRPDGFFLNGEKSFLRGVCLHHDAGALGAVWNDDAWVRRLNLLKDMGCNAIRTSHNPPAPELLDLCDRMGFLVMDELTDTWTWPKKENGYATLFDEWAEKDLVALIHRDRNHPSVVLWSIGNECGEQGDSTRWWIPQMLTDICHREDPSRLTSAGNDNLWASTTPYHETQDVYGFNYKPHAYADFHKANPLQPVFGSETASCISTRGYYYFPVSDEKGEGWPEEAPFQVSSYDLYAPGWASKPDYEWFYEDEAPYLVGEFVWTGFDYLGEPTPYNLDPSILTNYHTEEEKEAARRMFASWGQKISSVPLPSRSSYFGIIDLAGFPKDRFWIYQARWRPELPMAHILPHWNWPDRVGQVTPVHVYTSGDSAELFINGKSQGLKRKGDREYRLRWDDVIYEPGTVEVVAYKDGREWARDKVETTGAARQIVLKTDYAGEDLYYVRVEITDRDGRIVPDACKELSFSISGAGEIVACDAGDPTSHVPFYSTEYPAFNGLCSVIVRRTGKGPFTLRASAQGLRGARESF
ncbi:MAG: DUF4982 domain-containing protein [Bacteroidales bacterium]|nr:DUF4982 domain-containing protein [Bacteroidales bacterium]